MKKRNIFKHLLSVMAVCLFIFLAFGSDDDDQKKNADGTPKTERQLKIEKQFSAWDGSPNNLKKAIKDAMNDPESFEHVETKYWDMKDHLVVLTTYRGKNAFGGKVKNWVKAKVDMEGNVLEIIEQGN